MTAKGSTNKICQWIFLLEPFLPAGAVNTEVVCKVNGSSCCCQLVFNVSHAPISGHVGLPAGAAPSVSRLISCDATAVLAALFNLQYECTCERTHTHRQNALWCNTSNNIIIIYSAHRLQSLLTDNLWPNV